MSREVRRVPATWEHPHQYCPHSPWTKGCDVAKANGGYCYKPMFDGDFNTRAREWMDAAIAWDNGTDKDAAENKAAHPFYWQWDAGPPDPEDYMPSWPDAERTHYQMYESVSEGTPISPVMESPEALARWLADNGANAGAGRTASYEAWLRVCNGGYAPSMVMVNGTMMSGVEFGDHD